MRTGSRIAVGLAIGAVTAVLVLAALVVVALGAAGAQESAEPMVRQVHLTWIDPDERHLPLIEGALDPATVLEISAVGYPADTTGTVRQCTTDTTRRCSNQLTIRTDNRGVAVFQYLVTDTVDPDGGCRLTSPRRCTVELSLGDRLTELDTVFVDEAPTPGRLSLDPVTDQAIGETVTVDLSGFPAGAELTLRVCAAPATTGPRCGPPGPEVTVLTDGDGSASASLTLDIDEVGEARIACGRRTPCQVVATSDTIGARASPARLDIVAAPSVSYDSSRLVAGLALAVLLGAVATRLVRTTDWRPPAEADGSAIDEAMWADLDAEAAAFDEAAAR